MNRQDAKTLLQDRAPVDPEASPRLPGFLDFCWRLRGALPRPARFTQTETRSPPRTRKRSGAHTRGLIASPKNTTTTSGTGLMKTGTLSSAEHGLGALGVLAVHLPSPPAAPTRTRSAVCARCIFEIRFAP